MATESTKKRKGSVFDADVDVDELMRKFLHAELDDLEAFLRRQEGRSELDYLSRRVSELLLQRNATVEQFGVKSTIRAAAPQKIEAPQPENAVVRKREQAEGGVDIDKLVREFLKADLDTLVTYIDARRGSNEFYLISQCLTKLDDIMKGLKTKFEDMDATILVSHILPFVADRADYYSFRQASKALNCAANDNPNLIPPWPTQTFISSEGFQVQCEFSSDGNLIYFLRYSMKERIFRPDYEVGHHLIIFHREVGFVKRFDIPCPEDYIVRKSILSPNCRYILLECTSFDSDHDYWSSLEVITFPEEFALKAAEPSFERYMVDGHVVATYAFSRDGGTVASVMLNEAGNLFAGVRELPRESQELAEVSSFTGYEAYSFHLCLSPDKCAVAMVTIIAVEGGWRKQVVSIFFPGVAEDEQFCLDFDDKTPNCIARCVGIEYSPDGTILAGVHSGGVQFWNVGNDYIEQGNIELYPPGGPMRRGVLSFSFLPCSKYIMLGTSGRRKNTNEHPSAEIWDVSTCTCIRRVFLHSTPLCAMNILRPCPADPWSFVADDEGKVGMHRVSELPIPNSIGVTEKKPRERAQGTPRDPSTCATLREYLEFVASSKSTLAQLYNFS